MSCDMSPLHQEFSIMVGRPLLSPTPTFPNVMFMSEITITQWEGIEHYRALLHWQIIADEPCTRMSKIDMHTAYALYVRSGNLPTTNTKRSHVT